MFFDGDCCGGSESCDTPEAAAPEGAEAAAPEATPAEGETPEGGEA